MGVFRKNNAYWIDYSYRGKRYRLKIGNKRKVAEEALSRIKVKIAAGEFVSPEKRQPEESSELQSMLFETFAIEEFLPWSKMQHSAKHYTRLEGIIRLHLIPFIGQRHLDEVTTKLIEEYKSLRHQGRYRRGRKTKKVKGATINREICCIKVIFRKAEEWGRLDVSPARGVKMFKETPKAPTLLEQEEIVRLLEEVPDRLKALIACAVYAGLRRSELFHLRWEDIRWKTGELHVVSREEHHTKNYQSRRIPMNEALVEALQHHPRRLDSPYVFANKDGQPYTDVREGINKAAEQAGISGGVKLHQLRHAFCSHALMQGIAPRTVQKWMGHKDLKTTLRYAHVSPDHEKAAMQQLQFKRRHYMSPEAKTDSI